MAKKFFAELVGTMVLVLMGCGVAVSLGCGVDTSSVVG
ncbi:MAG: aquaporin, partial [Bacteroidales bacterium]|nr:aquaporin [Bacteroidales bacterium]